VVVLTNILKLTWNAKLDQGLFARMSRVNAGFLLLYAVLRLGEIVIMGKLRFLGANWPTLLFLFEMALFLVPAFMFLSPAVQVNRGKTFGAALLTLAAGAMYRIDTYMTVYRPAGWGPDGKASPAGWEYFPSVGETIVTLGMAAVGVAIFLFISRKFPVVVVDDRPSSGGAGVQTAASH